MEKNEEMKNWQEIIRQLPERTGPRPLTTKSNPHMQLNQQPEDLAPLRKLMTWAFSLPGIAREPSRISVPGAVAMCLHSGEKCTDCHAFMTGDEFAHFHPYPDYSMHLGLPKEVCETLIEKGWGEWHPVIQKGWLPPNFIMLYAPRDEKEADAAQRILECSYDYARGKIAGKGSAG